jgi:phosphatidylinositol alpha 1,6-mannosyltransferase
VDTTLFHPDRRSVAMRRRLGARDDQVLVLHVGRLAAEKNLDVLADAFNLTATSLGARAVLAVAGDGPCVSRLRSRVPGLRTLGFLRPGELAQVYASADMCVFPSFTETCGLVALEAMASGTAVIAADAGGFPENIVHGRTGLLEDPRDAAGFARSIVRLALDPSLRHLLGAAGRRFAVTRDRAVEDDELLAQYAAVASDGKRAPMLLAPGLTHRWRQAPEGAPA